MFTDTFIAFDELIDVLKASNTLTRELLKELDEEGYIRKAKYGKKIRYSANLAKIDELKK